MHHPFSNDQLFRQIIETELDSYTTDLSISARAACIEIVCTRMSAEIEEHLAGADLSPQLLIHRIREEVERASKQA